MYLFTPPIALHNPPVLPEARGIERRLFRYLGAQPSGLSVVGPYPTYTTVETPDQLRLAGLRDGVDYFLGGHIYHVSDVVATALQASGYGTNLTQTTWGELAAFSWEALDTWEAPI